jgi:hypothetical protein
VPDSFLCCTVTSILKKGKSPLNCSSYRSIILSCNLSEVSEYILLPHLTTGTDFGENQLGFQPGIGCNHAHRILSSLLLDASRNKQSIHLCALDISKTFDSVKDFQLFHSLFTKGINLSGIFLLKYWYSTSFLNVKVNGSVFQKKIPFRKGV